MNAPSIAGLRGVYVTSGVTGFYYRQHAGGGTRNVVYVPRPEVPSAGTDVYATETIASAGVESLSDCGKTSSWLRSTSGRRAAGCRSSRR